MYVKISIISLFALLLIGGATTPSIVFGDPAFNVPDKYSPESTSCSLPDETVTFSVDKNSYKFGDEIKVSGQVIPKLSTNYSDQSKNYVYIQFLQLNLHSSLQQMMVHKTLTLPQHMMEKMHQEWG